MRTLRHLRLAAFATFAALAVGCSDSTGPSNVQPADLSQVLSELQPSSLAPLNSQISAAPVAGLSAPVPSSCSYDATSKSFICPNVSVTGVNVSRSFTLFDASGNTQTAFDKTTTAAVEMKTAFAGTVTSAGSTIVIDQQQDVTLSGLLTGVHTLNGTSLGHMNGTVTNGTTTVPVATTISTTITNLVLPQAGAKYPQSGTISASITNAPAGLPSTTATVTITFNGTSKANVSVAIGGITTTTTVDLGA